MTKINETPAGVPANKGRGGQRRKTPETAAVESRAPAASAPSDKPKGKVATLVALLQTPEGATVEAMMTATGWQAHSVRGALSGAIKKGLGLAVTSDKTGGVRRYRIAPEATA